MLKYPRLRAVAAEEINTLAERVEKYMPSSATVYGFLSIGFRIGSLDVNKTKVFVPDGDDFPFVFVVITNIINREDKAQSMTCFWKEGEIPQDAPKEILKTLPNFDWTRPFFLYACHSSVANEVTRFLLSPGGPAEGILYENLSTDSNLLLFKQRIKIERKTDIEVRDIPPSFAKEVHFHWEFNHQLSVEDIKEMIETLPSSAVYCKSPDSEEMIPVSWALTKQNGEIGMTYTLQGYRQKGYSKIATEDVVDKVLKMNLSPIVFVGKNNIASNNLTRRLALKFLGNFSIGLGTSI